MPVSFENFARCAALTRENPVAANAIELRNAEHVRTLATDIDVRDRADRRLCGFDCRRRGADFVAGAAEFWCGSETRARHEQAAIHFRRRQRGMALRARWDGGTEGLRT